MESNKNISAKDRLVQEYIKTHNIYAPNNLGYNLRAMCKYARETNREVSELTPEEVQPFAVDPNAKW